jgi:hypothetical protein
MTTHETLYALAEESEPDAAATLTRCGDAARDMLAALKAVMLHLPDFADDDQPAIVAACEQARTAIAKAEGRADD